jgi:hypothetical protein
MARTRSASENESMEANIFVDTQTLTKAIIRAIIHFGFDGPCREIPDKAFF